MAGLPRLVRHVQLSPWQLLPLALGLALVWLLAQRLGDMDLAAVPTALAGIGPVALLLACVATWASFRTMGAYEAAIHGIVGTGVSPGRAARSGRLAVATAQFAGFGAVTGALARWRCLPEIDAKAVAQVSALASALFLLGLLPLAAGALLIFPPADFALPGLMAAALATVAVFVALPNARGHFGIAQQLTHGRLLALAGWITADVVCAGTVFWLCLPDGADIGFAHALAAFVAALAAGLLTNAPGGLGAFELVLLALLPGAEATDLLAAILAYRAIYQGLPALLALPALLRAPASPPDLRRATETETRVALAAPPCPEWGLLRQGAELWVSSTGMAALLGRAPGQLVAIGRQRGRLCLSALAQVAAEAGRTPVLYKCTARNAARARAAGWRVIRIARDGQVDAWNWSTEGARHRQLRRKLRQAEAAGVVVSTPWTGLPLDQMGAVAARWAAEHGGDRGFSCGTFSPALVMAQRVFLAWQNGRVIAFVTCNTAPDGWSLDLMRHLPDTPPGTMHALVVAAIEAARSDGAYSLSLAAVTDLAPRHGWLARRLPRGLDQFKASFAPSWTPLYAAAPGPLRLALALGAIWFEVRYGHRLRSHDRAQATASPMSIELGGQPCDASARPRSGPAQPERHAMTDALTQMLSTRDWILADGATGTTLFNMGLQSGDAPELWNDTHPDRIEALYSGAVDAGSDLFLTNSFGGNASRLKLHGAERRVGELNRIAAEIGRSVADRAGRPVIVAGSVGPTGEIMAPMGSLTFDVAVEMFHEQAEALKAGGADVLWVETISAEDEFKAAAEAFRRADMPWCGTMSFDTAGRTMMGVTSQSLAKLVEKLPHPPLAFGANCGTGASDLMRTVLGFAATGTERPVIAKGNAGIPKYVDGHIHYDGTPSLMADYAALARNAGARIIGGCCGTTPDHLRAMREALESRPKGEAPTLDEIVAALGEFSSADDGTGDSAPPARQRRGRRRG